MSRRLRQEHQQRQQGVQCRLAALQAQQQRVEGQGQVHMGGHPHPYSTWHSPPGPRLKQGQDLGQVPQAVLVPEQALLLVKGNASAY